MSIRILQQNIAQADTDAVVNAANEGLYPGNGVCGAIFAAADYDRLLQACREIGGCPTGSAVLTDGCGLKAKYIIHAVGPIWREGDPSQAQLLAGCYRKSLELAAKHHCRSITFPLISSGIFGYPSGEAWEIALQTCATFDAEFPMDIRFAVLSAAALETGTQYLKKSTI